MLVACRLAGLSALEVYAGVTARAQCRADRWGRGPVEPNFSLSASKHPTVALNRR